MSDFFRDILLIIEKEMLLLVNLELPPKMSIYYGK